MKSKIIILGAHGMLGWQILNEFNKKNHNLICQVRNKKSSILLKKKTQLE